MQLTGILWISIALVSVIGKIHGCPYKCTCHRDERDEQYVDCTGRQLETVPTNIPVKTNTLILIDNNIESLLPLAFQDLHLLQSLFIGGNQLHQFDIDIFRSMPALQLIGMPDNFLTELDIGITGHLPNLMFLDLSNNSISDLKMKETNIPSYSTPVIILTNNPLNCCSLKPSILLKNITIDGECSFPKEINKTKEMDLQLQFLLQYQRLYCSDNTQPVSSGVECGSSVVLALVSFIITRCYLHL